MMDPRYPPTPPEPGYRRARGRQRSSTSQTGPAIVLVLVLVVSVIGITRYIAGRTVAQREQASVTVSTGPQAGQAGNQGGGQGGGGQATATTQGQAPPTTAAGGAQAAGNGDSPVAPDGTGANGNLIANAGFEDGLQLQGWKPVGAQAQRVKPGWESDRSVLVRPSGSGGSVAGIQTLIDRDKAGRAVSATAWVRAVEAGVNARITVIERAGGRTVAGDAVTLPLYDTQWHVVQVNHDLRGASGTIALAVGLAPGQAGKSLLVDAVAAVAARPAKS